VQAIARQVRCHVCQNETLADSQADLAGDLRREIHDQMAAGRTDDEITAYLTQRYSDFVLYRPPLKPRTYLLWFGPFGLLAVGFLALGRHLQLRPRAQATARVSPAQQRRARRLLDETSSRKLVG
jgi:cytochrome c-type biogenesis protein CcmH